MQAQQRAACAAVLDICGRGAGAPLLLGNLLLEHLRGEYTRHELREVFARAMEQPSWDAAQRLERLHWWTHEDAKRVAGVCLVLSHMTAPELSGVLPRLQAVI